MPGMTGTFDATKVEPKQGSGGHAIGNKFQAFITDTTIEPAKDGKSGMLTVEFTSPGGVVEKRYSLWHENPTTVRIANEQLSALCHAMGIFQIVYDNDCAALRGGQCLIDVGFQKGQEPSVEKPAGGYVEIKKIYDKNGNEPGKTPAVQGNVAQQQNPNPPSPPPAPNWSGVAAGGPAGGWSQQANGAPANPPWGGGTR